MFITHVPRKKETKLEQGRGGVRRIGDVSQRAVKPDFPTPGSIGNFERIHKSRLAP